MSSRGVNKVEVPDRAFELYAAGSSIPEVSEATGVSMSTLRLRFKEAGILRSRADGVRMAGEKGNLGGGLRGKRREFTKEHCNSIRSAKLAWAEVNAAGVSVKPNGYVEYTRGPHKGRLVHVVSMEKRLGRRLQKDEVVHHIDGNRQNNADDNLALCTRSGHNRLHQFENQLSGKVRRRSANGSWC